MLRHPASRVYRRVKTTKLYLYFGRFAGNAILCSNCFLIFLIFRCLFLLSKYNYLSSELNQILNCVFLHVFCTSTKVSIPSKCQLRPSCIHMTIYLKSHCHWDNAVSIVPLYCYHICIRFVVAVSINIKQKLLISLCFDKINWSHMSDSKTLLPVTEAEILFSNL